MWGKTTKAGLDGRRENDTMTKPSTSCITSKISWVVHIINLIFAILTNHSSCKETENLTATNFGVAKLVDSAMLNPWLNPEW
jgi:hypothetical protein